MSLGLSPEVVRLSPEGYKTNFYTGRLRPKVKPVTFLF